MVPLHEASQFHVCYSHELAAKCINMVISFVYSTCDHIDPDVSININQGPGSQTWLLKPPSAFETICEAAYKVCFLVF